MFWNKAGNAIIVDPTAGNGLTLCVKRRVSDEPNHFSVGEVTHLSPADALKLIGELTSALLLIDELERNKVKL